MVTRSFSSGAGGNLSCVHNHRQAHCRLDWGLCDPGLHRSNGPGKALSWGFWGCRTLAKPLQTDPAWNASRDSFGSSESSLTNLQWSSICPGARNAVSPTNPKAVQPGAQRTSEQEDWERQSSLPLGKVQSAAASALALHKKGPLTLTPGWVGTQGPIPHSWPVYYW